MARTLQLGIVISAYVLWAVIGTAGRSTYLLLRYCFDDLPLNMIRDMSVPPIQATEEMITHIGQEVQLVPTLNWLAFQLMSCALLIFTLIRRPVLATTRRWAICISTTGVIFLLLASRAVIVAPPTNWLQTGGSHLALTLCCYLILCGVRIPHRNSQAVGPSAIPIKS